MGAHVSGGPAFIIANLIELTKVDDRLRGLPPELRAATLETLDDIRGAAAVWDRSRKGNQAPEVVGIQDVAVTVDALESFLTTAQAADVLGVSERRVRQLADVGTLAGRKLGRQWQLDPESVQARRLAADISEGSEN
ncbi:helix-turn-helix domain-containing protein [Arthrobacter alpinus]|uniref:helix-turn-helix domain-containing protein n=1 Tax=Arthrobacter alpinus TaxID=656366 RepID=UPI0012FED7EF|nr:helix-turn-helix domain-containing protein [Arthrobacter alpinus]